MAPEIGGPVALKADFAAPAHASDIDAVLLGLEGEPAVRSGWRELERRVQTAGREWTGAIVQRLVAPGADVLVGAFSDPDLGPVIAVGLGGRRAGLGRNGCVPPAAGNGHRSRRADRRLPTASPPSWTGSAAPLALDREALRELILRFALLLGEVPEVVEADLNPVRCTTNGCVVLDMRLRIERRRPVERVKTW